MTGKGGVGRTRISCQLAEHAAKIGYKTIIVEVNGSTSLQSQYKLSQCYSPTQIQDNLYTLSITPEEAIKEYAIKQLRFQSLYKIIFQNRYVKPLVHGAPGLKDAVQLGKIYDLHDTGQYDIIVVDAPATGHCLTMLEAAQTMMDLTKVGPMYSSNALVESTIGNVDLTGIVITTTLEELPVNETFEFYEEQPQKRQNKCWVLSQTNLIHLQ